MNKDCWLWAGGTTSQDYGLIGYRLNGKKVFTLMHRLMYEDYYGPIPEGLELDHLCRTPRCINPLHLEAVTHRENMLRSNTLIAMRAKQKFCLKGHQFREARTVRGNRVCLPCKAERAKKYALAKEISK